MRAFENFDFVPVSGVFKAWNVTLLRQIQSAAAPGCQGEFRLILQVGRRAHARKGAAEIGHVLGMDGECGVIPHAQEHPGLLPVGAAHAKHGSNFRLNRNGGVDGRSLL